MERFDGTAARTPSPFVPTGAVGAVGRYALHDRIASGGMASVHLGRLQGEGGFARIVAIKRLHPHLGEDPAFVSMFLDEARLVARIRHPNVVPTLDVVAADGEMLLVMEYVPGESLARLAYATTSQGAAPTPPRIAAAAMCGVLHGLHAAHEAHDEQGAPLHIVHRDVSPQNILVGVDGIARLLDFGVAKARSRLSQTRDGEIKGKLAYMAPEQLRDQGVDRKTDVYAAGVVLWEALTGSRIHGEATEASIVERILYGNVQPPSALRPSLPPAVDRVVLRALAREPGDRHSTAREMAEELESALGVASMSEVSEWVTSTASVELARRAALVAKVESSPSTAGPSAGTNAHLDTDDTHPEGRPSRDGALAFGLGSDTMRTTRRPLRAVVGVAALAMLVGTFLAVRSMTTSLAATSAPPERSVTAVPSAASLTTSADPSSSTPLPSSAPSSAPSASASVASVAQAASAPSVRPHTSAVTHRPKATKGRASALPDDLPSDRE